MRREIASDVSIAIRHPEEAGQLIDHHIGIRKDEEGGKYEAGPVTEIQRSEVLSRSDASQSRRQVP